MTNDLYFRIILAILFISFIVHRGYYSRRLAQPEVETVAKSDRNWLEVVASWLSLGGIIAVVIYIINPEWMAWSALPLPIWFRWAGVGMALSGFVLLQWAQNTLGKNWSDEPRLMKGQALITSGPYRWIRHPIYTAFLLILSSPLLISANWFIGMLWIGSTVLDVIARMKVEEELLLRQFGDQYRAYQMRTGRLFPRLNRSEGS
jgi:protein-S-isoprenylcysteine O-methyltransferase Ste14